MADTKITNLRNEIDIELLYINEEGRKGIKKVHITFVSQAIYKAYNALQQEIIEAIQLGERLKTITQDIGYEAARRSVLEGDLKPTKEDVKDTIHKLQKEYENAVARLNEISDHIDEKKMALIKKILVKNGIEDKDLYDPEWWEECVNMEDMMRFIKEACTKDDQGMDDKKKLKNLTNIE